MLNKKIDGNYSRHIPLDFRCLNWRSKSSERSKRHYRLKRHYQLKSHLSLTICLLISGAMFGVSSSVLADFGIRPTSSTSGVIYFQDQNWSGSWNYVCLGDNCVSGAKVNGYWERAVDNLSEGVSYGIQLKVQDNATGQYISPMETVVFSASGGANTPPTVDLVPPSGTVIAGDSMTVAATATDSDGTISSVTLYATAPGGSEQNFGTDTTTPYTWIIDNTVVGNYSLRAVGVDNDGATAEDTATKTVSTPGNAAPEVSLDGISGNQVAGGAVTVNSTASDTDGTVSFVELFYSAPSAAEESAGMLTAPPYTWTISNLVAGSYALRVVATDDDNATAEASDAMTVVDNGDPSTEDFGIDSTSTNSGVYWFTAKPEWPTTGTFYSCKHLESDCYPATLNNGRWEREQANLVVGQTYTAQLKVPGFSADDFPQYTFVWQGNGGGDPDPGDPGDPTDPDFAHLDWTSNSLTNHRVGPPPRPNPPSALRTPINGAAPTSHGFAFDINGNQLSWRWGPQIIKGDGDSGLEMHCSDDNDATYQKVAVVGGTASIPCSGDYNYFFRYLHPTHSLNNNPAHRWIWTGLFTTEGARVDPHNYPAFTDGSANWMRFRHPVSHDGTTAAVLDAQHNNDLLRNLDRYNVWVDDSPGNVQLGFDVDGSVLRVESMRNTAGGPNGQQFFALNQNPGFDGVYSYGQVIAFEISAVAGATGAQTYNDFSYYTVGYGWSNYGDPRLNPAGKASTTMVLSDNGTYSDLEYNAIFTQPVTTIHSEDMVDDFILGHHLFHGIDPNKQGSTTFDEVKIGAFSCGGCHFRDGRGFEVVNTPKGPRLAPPTFGVKLLEVIEGRETGFSWDGSANTVADQVRNALINDHGVDPDALPGRVLELMTTYTEMLTVPARDPGSYDRPGVAEGDVLFNQIGCGGCHTPVQRTRSDAPVHLRDLTLRPYTDMKLWDLGSNDGSFRTAPLWGLGHNIRMLIKNNLELLMMHDGSATSVHEAIQQHGGSASSVRSAYNNLSAGDKQKVVDFVESL